MVTKQWHVDVVVDDTDGRTYAEARLDTGGPKPITGRGRARVSPMDEDIPAIGAELAAARALTDLGYRLLLTAAGDIQAVTHEPVRLTH
ncbi:dsRBD fold-containing protein [Actinocatenispora rupis]|uniref:DUF1876 domain-containing protein n=1 Tax=Actinocatenispora rupis TaxID=519421 RepID=A0A8J3ND73_9ACTN|nr:dsRBD fold-containing protein [Actinocatenispora rupis]GID12577.1 hypothetical protein Aru02nite_34660 [Actinocatenispora rupis]